MPTSQSGEEGCFVFQPVTPDDVRTVILDMPTNKAPGFDKVPISVVKDCLEHWPNKSLLLEFRLPTSVEKG